MLFFLSLSTFEWLKTNRKLNIAVSCPSDVRQTMCAWFVFLPEIVIERRAQIYNYSSLIALKFCAFFARSQAGYGLFSNQLHRLAFVSTTNSLK